MTHERLLELTAGVSLFQSGTPGEEYKTEVGTKLIYTKRLQKKARIDVICLFAFYSFEEGSSLQSLSDSSDESSESAEDSSDSDI